MPHGLVAVILHDACPVQVRQQRRVFEAQHLQQIARAQYEIVCLAMHPVELRIDFFLELPHPGETRNKQAAEHQRPDVPGLHFMSRREKIVTAAASTIAQ